MSFHNTKKTAASADTSASAAARIGSKKTNDEIFENLLLRVKAMLPSESNKQLLKEINNFMEKQGMSDAELRQTLKLMNSLLDAAAAAATTTDVDIETRKAILDVPFLFVSKKLFPWNRSEYIKCRSFVLRFVRQLQHDIKHYTKELLDSPTATAPKDQVQYVMSDFVKQCVQNMCALTGIMLFYDQNMPKTTTAGYGQFRDAVEYLTTNEFLDMFCTMWRFSSSDNIKNMIEAVALQQNEMLTFSLFDATQKELIAKRLLDHTEYIKIVLEYFPYLTTSGMLRYALSSVGVKNSKSFLDKNVELLLRKIALAVMQPQFVASNDAFIHVMDIYVNLILGLTQSARGHETLAKHCGSGALFQYCQKAVDTFSDLDWKHFGHKISRLLDVDYTVRHDDATAALQDRVQTKVRSLGLPSDLFGAKATKKRERITRECAWCRKQPHLLPEGSALKACSRCKSVYYCSTDCQKKHWSEHKKTCVPAEAAAPPAAPK